LRDGSRYRPPAIEANSNTPVQIINALMARPAQPPAKIYYYVPPPVEGPAGRSRSTQSDEIKIHRLGSSATQEEPDVVAIQP
jgi:hypothetical protein